MGWVTCWGHPHNAVVALAGAHLPGQWEAGLGRIASWELRWLITVRVKEAAIKDRRYRFGILSTIIWLTFIFGLLLTKQNDLLNLSLNEWGDFFAGAFAPLAFLWLVLGYLQQGEELGLSTEALHLQAVELRNAVAQQQALVALSREQIEGEREALQEERQRRIHEFKPNITYDGSGASYRGDGQTTYSLIFINSGNTALRITGTIRHQLGKIEEVFKETKSERGTLLRMPVEVERPELIDGVILDINYFDMIDNKFIDRYLITKESIEPGSPLRIKLLQP